MDIELTNQFEEELDQIRDGREPKEVIEHAHKELDKILTKFKKLEKDTGVELIEAKRIERDIQDTLFQCPVCEMGTLRIKFSPKNKRKFVGCDKYPECEFTAPLPGNGLPKPSDKTCESCNWPMIAIIRKGRGPSVECINPKCPAKVKIEKAQEKMAKESGEGEKCPNCEEGRLVLKKGRFGAFLGCDQYPKCKTIKNIPKNKEEQKEQEEMEKKAKKAGEGKQCPNCETGKLKLRKSARGYFLGCDKYPKCKTVVKIPD